MNILITGGASGLGKAITLLLAGNETYKVYFTYNSSSENAKEIEKQFQNSKALQCDFKDEKQVDELLKIISQLDLDVLINNAFCGIYEMNHFHKTNPDSYKLDFENNILPVIKIAQSVIKIFRKKKKGKIITILTSYLSNMPPLGVSVYVAGKAYLKQLSKVWAIENIKYNITSNSISPSFMETELNNKVDQRLIEQLKLQHPLKKLLTPEEVANTIACMINSSDHMNGVDIVLNAGA